MKKLFIALAIASFAAGSLQVASYSADNNMPGPDHPPFFGPQQNHDFKDAKKHRPNLKKELKLTQFQEKQANDLREISRKKIKPLVDQMWAEKHKLRALEESSTSSNKDIMATRAKIKELREQIRKVHEDDLDQFESILTPQQKTKFEKIKKDHFDKRNQMMRKDFRSHHEGEPPFDRDAGR